MLLALSIVLKVSAMALLARVAWDDLVEQRIANRDVLILLGLGGGLLALAWFGGGSQSDAFIAAGASLALFCLLIPFWLMRKIGAGDVKLLAVAPIVSGAPDLALFSILLLVAAVLTAMVVKNPLLLPEGMFRGYVVLMDRKGVVPFGVPISAALIGVLLLQVARALGAYPG